MAFNEWTNTHGTGNWQHLVIWSLGQKGGDNKAAKSRETLGEEDLASIQGENATHEKVGTGKLFLVAVTARCPSRRRLPWRPWCWSASAWWPPLSGGRTPDYGRPLPAGDLHISAFHPEMMRGFMKRQKHWDWQHHGYSFAGTLGWKKVHHNKRHQQYQRRMKQQYFYPQQNFKEQHYHQDCKTFQMM